MRMMIAHPSSSSSSSGSIGLLLVLCLLILGLAAAFTPPPTTNRGLVRPLPFPWGLSSTSEGGEGPEPSEFFKQLFKGAAVPKKDTGSSPLSPGPGTGASSAWARQTESIAKGTILIANPAKFLKGFDRNLARQFLVPSDVPPEFFSDNYDQLVNNFLPVILLTGHDGEGHTGFILNKRSGLLLGDVAENSSGFKIQPLLLGGNTALLDRAEENPGVQGFTMLHPYSDIPGAKELTPDGLCLGGDYETAVDLVKNGRAMSSRFRFFMTKTRWMHSSLAEQLRDKVWFPAEASREVILQNRGREGVKIMKPLWTELMELMGGSFKDIKEGLYTGQYS